MRVHRTELEGVLLIEPAIYPDDRGYFLETWQARRYHAGGVPERFV
ncbi:MAG: dTDP-4-dehydrorhamnose 3,5-epimerase, partial [Bacteroidetes bacterium]